MAYESHGYGWACVDCLFMLANGEVESWDEWETYAWELTVAHRLGDVHVDLGGSTDCYCEREEFSWSPCDVCGSTLGGSRDAVHFWTQS